MATAFQICDCHQLMHRADTHFRLFIFQVFVVSFSSCLDVAAISMDMGEALDVNHELTTVGLSNCKCSCNCWAVAGSISSYIILHIL